MSEISILDLQNLRHLIGQDLKPASAKCRTMPQKPKNPEIRKLFQDAADSAMKNRQDLMKFL